MNFAALLKETINGVQDKQDQDIDGDHIDEELENILAHPAPSYNEKDYWEIRYERDTEELDWYQTWDTLKPVIGKYIPKDAKVLSVGCGNSPMNAEIVKAGASEVHGLDFSHNLIEQMKTQYESEPKLVWDESDATKMPYEDNYFDFIFDKGTLDCFVSTAEATATIPTMLGEVSRVLKPGGVYVLVSYGTPNTRTPFLKHPSLSISLTDTKEVEELNEPGTFHYVYICKKKE